MEDAWQKALRELKQEIPGDQFNPFLEPLRPVRASSADDVLVLGVSDQNVLPRLDPYRARIQTKLRSLMGRDVRVSFELFDANAKPERRAGTGDRRTSEETFRSFNPSFDFDRFIVSRANELASIACQTVAQDPGKTNPLYIYGDVGLGKTHLLHATAQMIQRDRPNFRICYLTVEDFKNEFIKAHREKRLLDFKNRFLGFDAFFIDDIDTLRSSQEATQEEFFHVFNAFYENGKQTVITSDRPAQDLMVSSRLMSRFITGLQVQLSAPDADLRRKFLEFRAGELGLRLQAKTLDFLGEKVTGNMRVLESALNKLYFLEQRGMEISDPVRISRELEDLLPRLELDHIPLEKILGAVCRRFSVSRENILSASRKSEYTRPRHIGMYLGVKYSGLNKSAIARFFHKNDHTTVINAEKNVKNRLKQDPGFALELENLIHELRKDRL